MNVSAVGRQLIERNEGCVLHTYTDLVGVLTIGYGCTGREAWPGRVITQLQADMMLADRLTHEFEPGVLRAIGDAAATQAQFDAMVSLAFNIGVTAFTTSSVAKRHREGKYTSAAEAFLLWNKAGGRVLDALSQRRQEERAMYLGKPKEAPVVKSVDPIVEMQMQVQRSLADAGFYHGEIDGAPGTATFAAMNRYRLARGV